MYGKRFVTIITLALAGVAFLAVGAQATAFTWSGTTSSAWNDATNWGGSGFPNAYTDTATIGAVTTNTPVSLSTTALLGAASGNVLTLSNVAGSATGLDITSTGLLGVQGGILLSSGTTNGRKITIEGTLRNDATSSSTTYTIGGGTNAGDFIQLVGGTISSLNGGKWTFSRPVQGYGTISSVFTGTVTANVAGQTLHITNPLESIGAASLGNTGGILSLEGTTLSGGALTATGGGKTILDHGTFNSGTIVATAGEVDIKGSTLNGVTNMSGNVQLTDDSALNTGGISNMVFNGHKLDVTGTVTNYGTIHVDAGTLNNAATTGTTTVGNSNFLYLTGGSITNTGGSNFVFGTNISGYGSVSGINSTTYGIMANGGTAGTPQTLTFDAGPGITLGTHSGSGVTMSSAAYSTLDLKGKYNYINPGIIAPGAGIVALDGATLNTYDPTGGVGGTPTTWNLDLYPGTINVTNNSTMIGKFTSAANLTVNSGKSLDASGATFINNGTVKNDGGTATWGTFTNNGVYTSDPSTNTFTNLTVGSGGSIKAAAGDIYQVKGDFTNNSTQNTLWDTAGATLQFTGGSAHSFALAGADKGPGDGANNFAWGTLDLTGQTLNLVDGNTTNSGTAQYVGTILGVTFDSADPSLVNDIFGSNGINIYYDPSTPGDAYLGGLTYNLENGGVLTPQVPIPASILLMGSGLLGMGLVGIRRRKGIITA